MSTTLGPFEPFANATLMVDVAMVPSTDPEAAGWITDPNTGNLIPSPTAIDELPSPLIRRTYKAHLHPVRMPSHERLPGVHDTSIALEGLLLDPWQFDDLVQPNQVFDAAYNGLQGKFELLPEQSRLPEFKSILGTRLYGVFRMAGAGLTT